MSEEDRDELVELIKVQGEMEGNHRLPTILYPQLLGLCMGINEKVLGLEANQIPLQGIEQFLASGGKRSSTGSPQPREAVQGKNAQKLKEEA